MITIYTSSHRYSDLARVTARFEFPEKSMSPTELLGWINDTIVKYSKSGEDLTIKTFSPLLIGALNYIILENKLTDKDIAVIDIIDGKLGITETKLRINEFGELIVDMTDTMSIVRYMTERHNAAAMNNRTDGKADTGKIDKNLVN